MISRREVVTAGVLGTLATGAAPSPAEAVQDGPVIRAGLTEIRREIEELSGHVQRGLLGSSLDHGRVGQVKGRLETFLKSSGKFPEFCDIGTSVFYDVYEWHVKHQQQINVTRMADQRLMIQFMFTQLILRWENDSNYIGMPFDR
ncbi:MAG: hypothetical protein Q8T13_14770 [Acidobacteriota bacterium]|nr:hypothetical protein [Acidobacteriota bacterium]